MPGAKQPQAFVLISFEDQFKSVYEDLIKTPLEEVGFKVERADSRLNQQNILRDIVRGIANADLVVADLTGLNPNVFYELGLAHALEVPTILVTQSIEEVPFDLRAYRSNEYSVHFTEAPKLRELLKEIGQGRIDRSITFGSPVTDFLPSGFRGRRAAEEEPAEREEKPQEPGRVTGTAPDGDLTSAVVDEEELGWFDALQIGEDAAQRFTEAMERLATATEAVGAQIATRTAEYERLAASSDPDRMKRTGALNIRVAHDLDSYAKVLEKELPAVEESSTQVSDAMDRLVVWLRSQPEGEAEEELASLRESAQGLVEATSSNLVSLRGFRESLDSLRGFSRPINSAIGRVLKGLDHLITVSETTEARSARIVTVSDTLGESASASKGAKSSKREATGTKGTRGSTQPAKGKARTRKPRSAT